MMLACLMMAGLAMAAEKQTASIERVTVFANGAQVVRSKSVQVVAGEQVITFTGMSPYMDRKSMQLKARGKLTVLGVTHRTVHPDSLEQMKRLHQAEDAVKGIQRKIQQAKDEKEVLASQLELVKTNCSVAGRTVATPLANIKELNNYYSQELLSLKKRTQDIDDELLKLNEELTKKQEVLDSISHIKLATATEVDVKVDAQQAGRADFDITYYVKNAGWFPSYDVRSDGTGQPLTLSYKANIYQNTKEEFIAKQSRLRELLRKHRNIRYIWHDVETSCWEGIYARGDRRLCDVILEGYKKGMIFDAWDQFFKYDVWEEILTSHGLKWEQFTRGWDIDDDLPWDVIDVGVTKAFLRREREKAYKEQTTDNCRKGCSGCGASCYKAGICP